VRIDPPQMIEELLAKVEADQTSHHAA
jgi:hypothetical protein